MAGTAHCSLPPALLLYRYIDNKNGTASFDWPGVRVSFTVSATTAISMSLSAPGNLVGEIRVYIDGVNGSTIIVDKSATNYPVASGLDASKQYSVTLYNVLEPALWHPQPFLPKAGDTIATLNSITVDGTLLTPPAPLKRNLVFVGDSITAGELRRVFSALRVRGQFDYCGVRYLINHFER